MHIPDPLLAKTMCPRAALRWRRFNFTENDEPRAQQNHNASDAPQTRPRLDSKPGAYLTTPRPRLDSKPGTYLTTAPTQFIYMIQNLYTNTKYQITCIIAFSVAFSVNYTEFNTEWGTKMRYLALGWVEWRLQLRDGRLGPKYPLVGGVRTGLNDNPRAEESTSKFSSSLREYF